MTDHSKTWLRRNIITAARDRYVAYCAMKLVTGAERQLAELQIIECNAMLEELQDDRR